MLDGQRWRWRRVRRGVVCGAVHPCLTCDWLGAPCCHAAARRCLHDDVLDPLRLIHQCTVTWAVQVARRHSSWMLRWCRSTARIATASALSRHLTWGACLYSSRQSLGVCLYSCMRAVGYTFADELCRACSVDTALCASMAKRAEIASSRLLALTGRSWPPAAAPAYS